jgi:ribonucleotide monophosphatase NagD (HAD superfamily)
MKLPHQYFFIHHTNTALARLSALAVAALLLSNCAQKPEATQEQLALLGSSCQAQMIATTCQAMKPTRGAMPNAGEVVFVAGVGPVDAQLLAKLAAAGQTMCDEVKATCATEWNGSACTALKNMYAPTLLNK